MSRLYQEDNFEKWVSQWDAAQQKGIFDAPKKDHVPSANNRQGSFFGGLAQNAPSEEVPQEDTDSWNSIYRGSRDYGKELDLDGYEEVIQEETAVETKKKSANPITAASLGMDQDVKNPASVGATYDIDQLQNLEGLKLKLHNLLSKLNDFEGRGESAAKFESKIQSLQKQIDELSSSLAID